MLEFLKLQKIETLILFLESIFYYFSFLKNRKLNLRRSLKDLYRDTYFVQKLKSLCIFEYLEQERVITAEIYFKTSKSFSI